MDKIVAMCGLICNDCMGFIATQKNDDKLKAKVAELWSTEKERFKPEDIDCDGCIDGKRLHKFCADCDVRKCGMERDIENCAYCSEFPCEKLEKLWKSFRTVSGEEAKTNLEKIRKNKYVPNNMQKTF